MGQLFLKTLILNFLTFRHGTGLGHVTTFLYGSRSWPLLWLEFLSYSQLSWNPISMLPCCKILNKSNLSFFLLLNNRLLNVVSLKLMLPSLIAIDYFWHLSTIPRVVSWCNQNWHQLSLIWILMPLSNSRVTSSANKPTPWDTLPQRWLIGLQSCSLDRCRYLLLLFSTALTAGTAQPYFLWVSVAVCYYNTISI